MKLIHLTDTHLVPSGRRLHGLDPKERLATCVAHVAAHHADAELCIHTGDVADAGHPDAYEAVREVLAELPMPVHLVPGNHDDRDAFVAAFPGAPRDEHGFVQQAIRLEIGHVLLLDTLEPARGHGGDYCPRRLGWLEARLEEAGDGPVYVFMHHPPFDIGIPALDEIALADPRPFEDAVTSTGNVRHIFFGHAHRPISGQWRGIAFSTLYGTSHQTRLDFRSPQPLAYTAEPPAYGIVLIDDASVVVHTCYFLEDDADVRDEASLAGFTTE